MATLPDGTPRPPIPDFPPPPPPSLGRKRQRGANATSKPLPPPPPPVNDEDANYIVYPSDDEDAAPGALEDEEDEGEETERPRNHEGDTDGDFEMGSETDFSEDQEPRRKRARPGEDLLEDEDNIDMNDPSAAKNKGKGRQVSQKWRQDVYRPSPEDSDDSDMNLHEITPHKKRGKRKSVGKTGSLTSRRVSGVANGLVRSKSKSTSNLKADKPAANKIRKSRFIEGSMGDRRSRPGGVPPFRNHQPAGEDGGVSEDIDNGSMSSASLMPPPPRPIPKGSNAPQSTPPPPKAKFTFLAPIGNWFSKRWRQATQEYEDRERKKEEEAEVQRQVRIVMERKAKAERIYAENKKQGINQPTLGTLVDQSIAREPLVSEEQVIQYMDPPSDIGLAYTTDEIYTAPKLNESRMSVATIRPPSRSYGASPRISTDTAGSGGSGDPARSSMPNLGAFHSYRDTNPRETTPLTVDTSVNSDVEGLRSRSRSPAPTPSKALTKAEQKKKERLEKKMDDLKKKLAETEMDLSQVIGVEVTPPTPKAKPNGKKAAPEQDTIILIHEDKEVQEEEEEDDEAAKIVESVMGEPEAMASVRARSRSKSPFKKLFHIGGKDTASASTSKKGKESTITSLHNVNESGRIKKAPPTSMRGRTGGRGGKAGSRSRRGTSEDPS